MNALEIKLVRYVLAVIWLVTGALSLGLYPVEESMELLQAIPLPQRWLLLLIYFSAGIDVVMGLLTLCLPHRRLWLSQIVLIVAYTLLATLLVPAYWLHPFGPLLKNLAVLTLLWLLYRHDHQGRVSS